MNSLRRLVDLLFPKGEPAAEKSELIERGLEALRRARDERGIVMGKVRLVPARLELRVPSGIFDEIAQVGGQRDVEFFLNDELMKDLKVEGMKTFGDAPVHVSIAVDSSLSPNEISASVLSIEPEHEMGSVRAENDRTMVLGADDAGFRPSTLPRAPEYRLVVRREGRVVADAGLDGRHWIVGRRGSSGRTSPDGCRKIDLELDTTVSREQLRLDMIDADRFRIQRLGQGSVTMGEGDQLAPGENRLIAVGISFVVEQYEMMIVRGGGGWG